MGGGNEIDYIHDEIATDKRNPTVNAYGPVYGVNISNDELAILDPMTHTATSLKIPLRDGPSTVPSMIPQSMPRPARYHRETILWTDPANPHNPMLDGQGRVWMTTAIRGRDNPDWCKEGSSHPSAKYFPLERSNRQAGYYDPETEKFVLIDTCYGTHHLQFAEDDDDTLWFSGDRQAIGWLNTKKYDETGDEQSSQGWCPTVIDTNGDGKIGRWVEPGEPEDPALDTRISVGSYGIIPSPVDASVWIVSTRFPGRLVRLDRGKNPPETCIAEVYEVPSVLDASLDASETGFGPRGLDVDRNGVVWTALSGSSHFASFDRRKCTVLNGTTATGRHCPEGWRLYPTPGPTMKGTTPPIRADYHYYSWVDQFDTLGLGENIPIANGSNSDSLLALMPDTGEWVVLRVPYPRGAFTRGLDGRIDDPDAGWKGRGVWATYGAAATWHIEGGQGVKPGLLRFQIRPNPLAN